MPAQEPYDIGDIVFAATHLYNDGGLPGLAAEAQLAAPGQRGVVVNFGHVQAAPHIELYLVRFEDAAGDLGPPVGCLAEELTQREATPEA